MIPRHAAALSALTALAAFTGIPPAAARPQPTPPPSGIVVHLFGPDSAKPAQAGAAPADSPGSSPSPSPSWGDIAHQMFVAGNPAQENRAALPKGRAGE